VKYSVPLPKTSPHVITAVVLLGGRNNDVGELVSIPGAGTVSGAVVAETVGLTLLRLLYLGSNVYIANVYAEF